MCTTGGVEQVSEYYGVCKVEGSVALKYLYNFETMKNVTEDCNI